MFAEKYLSFIIRMKYIILALIGFSTLFFILNLDSQSLSNSSSIWIKGSSDHQKLLESDQLELLGKTIKVKANIDNYTKQDFEELQKVHQYLVDDLELEKVDSIFNHYFSLKIDDGEGSSFIELTTLYDIDDNFKIFQDNKSEFLEYFSNSEIDFYIYLKHNIDIGNISTSLEYSVENMLESESFIEESVLLIGLGLVVTALLTISFHSLSAPITGIIFLIITSSATIYIFKLFMGDYTPHISILILSFSISFMDYLYIYYRWFMLQQSEKSFDATAKTVENTFSPIFFTTLVNILGIGSLIFVGSDILQSLGLMVIISSLIGLIYSFTFLPILLSFISTKKRTLESENFSQFFSKKISNYNPIALKIFSNITIILVFFSIYNIYTGVYHVDTENSSKIIKLTINHDEINLKSMEEIEKISELLNINEVEKINSPYQTIKKLYKQEEGDKSVFNLQTIDFDRYIFMLDMFGDEDQLFNSGKVKVDIYLKDIKSKGKILKLLKKSGVEIYITDVDTLLQSAKIETINIIVILIISILMIISIVIFVMTKRSIFSVIGMIVGLVPITWFFAIVTIFDYPISTEMFVAMIISVAISSDATIHLLHYYHKLDSEDILLEESGIQKLFLYVESPLILGNMILAITFFLMIIANISSIMLIGIFSAIIVLLSLITDIFILPVMILEYQKKMKKG